MFVKYIPKHPHVKVVPVVDGIAVAAGSVILNPGVNEVSDAKWEKIKGCLAPEIAEGTVMPFSVRAKKSGQEAKARTLKDVPVQAAVGIISECSNKDTLRAWFNDALPDEIALHVVRRMRALDMDLDAIAGDGEGISGDDIIDEGRGDASEKAENGDGGAEAGKDAEGEKPGKEEKARGGKNASGKGGGRHGADDIPDFDNPDAKVE